MTNEQQHKVSQVREVITVAREILDSIMYGSDPISNVEHEKLREAYDLLCKTNDTMP